ncbi:hypothetical protein ACFOUP_09190 [Belliella kenyensis]|uniref:YceI-like domain-containing protein n=1 Tax=Belliella kenyensis TaxID=1472724 RepID=A0ABV8EKA7_9BACT|nr:hypothetical protein [Belliella kenyensis]MCH7403218.1 hypothetical protein [Belliella kenyensis]MDN3604829.1 hypothetical protein [Belliella kenyensis]
MHILLALIFITYQLFLPDNHLIINNKVITVHGNTSLGSFKCDYVNQGLKDTLYVNDSYSKKAIEFDILVREFGCGNFILNSDFRKTIKAEEYPKAKVAVTNLRQHGKNYTCDLTVNLVGKKLQYNKIALSKSDKQLTANIILNFEELDLSPPRKMGGLIKVEEQLALEIKLGF